MKYLFFGIICLFITFGCSETQGNDPFSTTYESDTVEVDSNSITETYTEDTNSESMSIEDSDTAIYSKQWKCLICK